jgi:hypothetical protein
MNNRTPWRALHRSGGLRAWHTAASFEVAGMMEKLLTICTGPRAGYSSISLSGGLVHLSKGLKY